MPTRTSADTRTLTEALVVVLLTVAAVLLRLPALDTGLWRDEAATYFDIVPGSVAAVLAQVTSSELNPPGFFLLMKYWTDVVGSGEIAFKLPALVFGVLLVPATYVLTVVTVESRRMAVVAALSAALAPEAIYYSQEARPYTLSALAVVMTMLFFLRSSGQGRSLAVIGLVTCATLSLYIHYTNLLLWGALAAATIGLYFWRRDANRALAVGAALLAALALFAPWAPAFVTHLATGTPWVEKLSALERVRLLYDNLVYTFPLPLTGAAQPIPRSTALLVVGLLAGFVWLADRRRAAAPQLAHAATTSAVGRERLVALTTILGLLLVMLATMSYSRRYVFPFAPLAWVVGAWLLVTGFDHLRLSPQRSVRWVAPVSAGLLAFAVAAPAVSYALTLGMHDKSGLRALARELSDEANESTIYLVTPDLLASTLGYYLQDTRLKLHGIPRWSRPEVFSPIGYQALWEQPTLVSDVTRRIADKAAQGARRLMLIQPAGGVKDAGQLRMSRAQQVFEVISRRYRLVETRQYPGTIESVTLYVFALSPSHELTSSRTRF